MTIAQPIIWLGLFGRAFNLSMLSGASNGIFGGADYFSYMAPGMLCVVFSALVLLNLGLSSLFIALTIRVKGWEAQTAVMNLLNLPLTCVSNALFPIKLMPSWLQPVASANPLSYATDAVRQAILRGATGFDLRTLTTDFLVLGIVALVLTFASVWISNRGLRK